MANAIAISLIKISMPDSTNIHTAAFITTIYLNKLNNTYYPIWKSIIKFLFNGTKFVEYLGRVRDGANRYS